MNKREPIANAKTKLGTNLAPWLSEIQPKSGPQLRGYLRTNWSQDPYALGSYSYVAKGSWRREHRQLAKPVMDRLFFAGEAANPRRSTSVHAALESGRFVANALLKYDYQTIVIVGAGIAGLSAAHTLAAKGRTVQLLEARDRIGGRIHSDYSLGVSCDLGASWLHGANGNPLTELTNSLGMRKVVTNTSWVARDRGKKLDEAELPSWIESISLYDNAAGAAAASVNSWSYLFFNDYSGDECVFPDGYIQLFDAFKGDYDLKLNQVVEAIAYSEHNVQVSSKSATAEYDAVVVTVPLGVLKAGTIQFTPALPANKQKAIQRLGMGTLDKIYLQFDDPFWDKEPHLLITPFTDFSCEG